MLRRIDDLRSAARAARRLADHLDHEKKQSILQLADDWEVQADRDEEEIVRYSAEAEAS